jgi:hypothetical protein
MTLADSGFLHRAWQPPPSPSCRRGQRPDALMHRYRDLPIDLADASLLILAEEPGEGRILSADLRDFQGYCWKNMQPFVNMLCDPP